MQKTLLSYNRFFIGMKAVAVAALICLAAAMASCRSVKTVTVEVPVPVHDTTYVAKEVHDSVWVENTTTEYIKGDTVFKEKVKVKYVERVRVDTLMTFKEKPVTVTVETKVTEYVEKPIPWWKKTLMYTGVFFLVGVVFFIVLLIIKSKT